jgi:ketosteroid isomerase-like protein
VPDEVAEIQQVIGSYALAIDERDFDRVAACFAEDAVAAYAGVELPPGRDAIRAWLEASCDFSASTHLVASPVVELDGERARAVTSAVAFLVRERGLHTRGLCYTDELERRGGTWQIVRRLHEARWEATQPW